ncbi:hypothetical protein [Streptomyces sp. NPDC059278]|uniref:hypothetical protein n=1 Tax=Streptomyces sp. NPDC059278 TaxID=3346801 RepID=UPI0036A531B6
MSTPTPGGKTWVDSAPPLEPYRYGLFSVASFTKGVGPSWQNHGVEYFSDACAQGGYVVGSCPKPVGTDGATTHDKPVTDSLNLVQGAEPFTVYERVECNAVGFEDPSALAMRRLRLIEERESEHYMSRELLGADGARLPLGSTAVGIKQAVGALEADAALFYAGAPTLHAPRWTNPYFEDRQLLQPSRDTGDVLRTHLHSRVAFGGGYYDNPFDPNTPPTAGFWLVATGSVRGMRSDPFVNETFTEPTNLRAAIAERTYALDADCYRAAVLVTVEGEG